MAITKTIKTIFQFRRGTTAEWELNKDAIPAAGEPCFNLDLNTLKIGDGETTYENLEPIGGIKFEIAADGKSVVLEDNTLKLVGFDAADVGAQPRKNSEGNIEWIVPSTETVEGLQTTVAGLQSDVTNLQTNVTVLQEIVTPSGEGSAPLLTRVETLENQINGNSEDSIDRKIDAKINKFATDISNDGIVNTFKELVDYVANHDGKAATFAADITKLQGLVGNESVRDQIAVAIADSGHITKNEANTTLLSKIEAAATLQHVKYEISHKPIGTLVDYRDKEIRVMVPANTKFELQNSGENADKNAYYVGFKAYAPSGATSFKEDLAEIISDNTMYAFEGNDFAGIDEYGRKYSIYWLAVAKYDEATQTWTRYGAQSSKEKYIGWYYSVEWYDADGVMIGSDCIRINLSNESCHNAVEPYYIGKTVKGVKVNGTLLDIVDGIVDITIAEQTLNIKGSDEIDIAEDGTITIKSISIDKIMQDDTSIIVMDGGGAV